MEKKIYLIIDPEGVIRGYVPSRMVGLQELRILKKEFSHCGDWRIVNQNDIINPKEDK